MGHFVTLKRKEQYLPCLKVQFSLRPNSWISVKWPGWGKANSRRSRVWDPFGKALVCAEVWGQGQASYVQENRNLFTSFLSCIVALYQPKKTRIKEIWFFFLISLLSWTPSHAAKHQFCQKFIRNFASSFSQWRQFSALGCGTLEAYHPVVAHSGYPFEAKENLLLLSWSNLFYKVQTRTRIDLSTIHSFSLISPSQFSFQWIPFPILFFGVGSLIFSPHLLSCSSSSVFPLDPRVSKGCGLWFFPHCIHSP